MRVTVFFFLFVFLLQREGLYTCCLAWQCYLQPANSLVFLKSDSVKIDNTSSGSIMFNVDALDIEEEFSNSDSPQRQKFK
jgi:hypothetical protein